MRLPVRGLARRLHRAGMSEVHAHWRRQPIQPDTVLYESFAGNGMLCNPEAIFRRLLELPEFAHLTHIWAIAHPEDYAGTLAEFAGRSDVRFVRRGSSDYHRALATSGFLVNNATFPPQFSKRPGQIYLNTWHGTPLKHMGFDTPDGPSASANTMRNFAAADYLLAQNPFMTQTMYRSAYKLEGLYNGAIIEEGYPRVDRQTLSDTQVRDVRRALDPSVGADLEPDARRIVVFAPTWRGASFQRPDDNIDQMLEARDEFARALDPDRWRVLLKVHQAAYALAARRSGVADILVPNSLPTNQLLGLADVLVTDYSSIFFDFLATGRPIVFYTPDQTEYALGRGLYRSPEQLPGPQFIDAGDAAKAVRRAIDGLRDSDGLRDADEVARYAAAQKEFTPFDDGKASDRVIDVVFRGNTAGHRIHREQQRRPSLLLHLGAMRPNGITTSAFNLVNSLDHEHFDVTVTYPGGPAATKMLETRFMNRSVRHMPRVGGLNGSKTQHLRRTIADRRGRGELDLTDPAEQQVWEDEWTRCFGDFRFDDVIDFSGYGPLWARLLLHSPQATRSIWLHNDMAADARRSVHGRLIHFRSLSAVFAHYSSYDNLVSVSKSLSEINRRSLSDRAPADKFRYARNCIDGAGIRAGASLPIEWMDDSVPAPPGFGVPRSSASERIFIAAGRLSPEKNFGRLIRAFARVHASQPDTRLVIVGGGPLRASLTDLAASLGLADRVHLIGQQANPYSFLAAGDCFVLSSDYEGQPMVLLEAAVLGLPIVTVDFPSVRDALPTGAATVVAQTDSALAEGMMAYLRGEVEAAEFDDVAYNREAVSEFMTVAGIRSAT